jgi:hypothetical protein
MMEVRIGVNRVVLADPGVARMRPSELAERVQARLGHIPQPTTADAATWAQWLTDAFLALPAEPTARTREQGRLR